MRIVLIVSLFFLIGVSCSSESSINVEQKIFEDIFSELVNETFQDFRKLAVPPSVPKNISKDDVEKMQLTFKKAKENHQIYLDTTNFNPIYVIINDSVLGYSNQTMKRLHNNERARFVDTTVYKKSFKIDLSKIKMSDDYILKYRSDFSSSLDEIINNDRLKYALEDKHLWQYSGMLYLYRIYFNNAKDYAVLEAGFNCGSLCGMSYIVFIKKENDKWIIDKVESNSVV